MFLSKRLRVVSTLIFSAAAICMAAHSSLAQSGPMQGPQIMSVNDPKNFFHYTPDQQKEFLALEIKYKQQITAIAENKSLTQDQKKLQAGQIQKEARAKFVSLLTPEQKIKSQKIDQIVQSGKQQITAIDQQVTSSLSSAQKARIKDIRANLNIQGQAILASSDSQELKAQKIQALQASLRDQIRGALTPSQRALVDRSIAIQQGEQAQEKQILAGK
jgi:hypothetical protein